VSVSLCHRPVVKKLDFRSKPDEQQLDSVPADEVRKTPNRRLVPDSDCFRERIKAKIDRQTTATSLPTYIPE
jgi:hypothetical protein